MPSCMASRVCAAEHFIPQLVGNPQPASRVHQDTVSGALIRIHLPAKSQNFSLGVLRGVSVSLSLLMTRCL